jgi:hypothetical protein
MTALHETPVAHAGTLDPEGNAHDSVGAEEKTRG